MLAEYRFEGWIEARRMAAEPQTMFKRKIYDQLVTWKQTSKGKTAALIEGARRVGKSTVAEAFARDHYADYLLLDFAFEDKDVKRLFTESIGDPDEFFRNLFLIKGKSLPRHNAAIIFDEVQLCPAARQAIKPLVADGRYEYIETGSLISIKQNTTGILIPSEERRLRMYPMDFEEFCWARGDSVTADAIRDAFDRKKPLGDAAHRRIMKDFRTYMAVGGMPQAVEELVSGDSFEEIDYAKRTILDLYEDDLHKYDTAVPGGRVSAIFKTIPSQLGIGSRRFRFAEVEKGARYDRLSDSLAFLDESMMTNVCTNVTMPDTLMEMYVQPERFKLFMGDTGLLVTQASGGADDSLYKALILDSSGANMGMVLENMVAQMLVAQGHALHYHEFEYTPAGASKPNRYEIDFLFTRGKRVCPVEVKSAGYRTHKSIDYFTEKYGLRTRERYVLCTKDLSCDGEVTYLPAYMAMCL
jgi:predicted AAA+ superfamily ATPase